MTTMVLLEHRGGFPHGPPSDKPWAANLQICVVFGVLVWLMVNHDDFAGP